MNNNRNVTVHGIGFVGLLTILFIALKLTGYIAWPWVWVLSPIWISAILWVVLVFLLVVVPLIVGAIIDRR